MGMHNKIMEAQKMATNYPDLVAKLVELGILSYTVDTATGNVLYRLSGGDYVLHPGDKDRDIAHAFSYDDTVRAVKNNQQGKTDYPGFMDEIAKAGVHIYEAILTGKKRVVYIGKNGCYEEAIPTLQMS